MQIGTGQIVPFGYAGAGASHRLCPILSCLVWVLGQFGWAQGASPTCIWEECLYLVQTSAVPSPALVGHWPLCLSSAKANKCVFQLAFCVILAFPDLVNLVTPFAFTCTCTFPLKVKYRSKMLAVLADELLHDWESFHALGLMVLSEVLSRITSFQRCLWHWWSAVVK